VSQVSQVNHVLDEKRIMGTPKVFVSSFMIFAPHNGNAQFGWQTNGCH
jgi:hypothetical protein